MFRSILSIASILVLSALSFAQDEVVAEGFGEGANRDEALINAKRAAVEKGIGTLLLSQTEVENFMLKRDQIITKTIGTVKSYDILKEGKSPDNLIQITIKAVLSKTTMREDLAAFHILIESMNKPRTMVIIKENNVGNEEPSNSSAETAILGFLKDPYEFDLIDPSVVQSIKSSQQKMAEIAGDAAAAAKLGTGYGAEVIITGTAVSRTADGMTQNLGGMVSVQADVTLRAVNCATGRIIGTADAHAAKVHISPNTAGNQAIAKAATDAAKKLLDGIIKEWTNQINNGATLSVNISGVTTFRNKKEVVQTIEGIAGVSAVRERNWDGQSKILELDVVYKGNASGFCDKADGLKMRAGSGSLAVSGVEGTRVNLVAQVM
jgi:hypothetical protein